MDHRQDAALYSQDDRRAMQVTAPFCCRSLATYQPCGQCQPLGNPPAAWKAEVGQQILRTIDSHYHRRTIERGPFKDAMAYNPLLFQALE